MEYKAKGKEGTNAKGQKKGSALGKVNKKGGNDRSGNEKKDKADDISNSFPNFCVLNEEEKLAFFEALSAARKNIERKGLPTRERFGTVHDEYLQYFAQDEKEETVEKKPESAPSVKPSGGPVAGRASPKEPKLSTPESPKQRALRRPQPVSPTLKKTPEPPRKNPFCPESEPNEFCESVIKRDTDKMIQIYLDKKKKVEEQWRKSSAKNNVPPATVPARAKTRERERAARARAVSRDEAPRAKTATEAVGNVRAPQFQALDLAERKEFFRILKEAHTNVLFRNPQETDQILTLEEVLSPYNGEGGAVTTDCSVNQESHKGKQQQQQQKNLRVKVTLTSGDNKRLSRTKSQIVKDSAKEDSCGWSKSVESIICPDASQEKQSKIPILKKAPQEKNECHEDGKEKPPLKELTCEDLVDKVGPTAADARKPGAKNKERYLTIKEREEEEERREMTSEAKEKPKEECEEDTRFNSVKLKQRARELRKRKAEMRKAQREKAQKEKAKCQAETAKKEKELKKKRKEERRRRFGKKDKKDECKSKSSFELIVRGKKIEKMEMRNECKENSTRERTNQEKKDECVENVPTESHNEPEGKKCTLECTSEEEKKEESEAEECGVLIQERDCVREREESENDEENEARKCLCEENTPLADEECLHQQPLECHTDTEDDCAHRQPLECHTDTEDDCAHQPATDSSESSSSSSCEDESWPEHQRTTSCQVGSAQVVKGTKSLAGGSLVEERPGEVYQAQEMAPVCTSGKVIVVDDNVIKRIKDLIQYLERKVNPKENLESEYVRLILSYTEYLTKVTESLVRKKLKKGEQVHTAYAAHDVRLKFEDKDKEAPKEDRKKARVPHSISENEFQPQPIPGPSGIEKKDDSRRKPSNYDFSMLSDSESSSNSEDENRTLTPSAFKKTGIPTTKIRLLQDLLKGRAKFAEGSVDDFRIVRCPEAEYVPPEKPPVGGPKEITEGDVDQGQKAMGMKFLRHLAKLCNCGRKQIEEEAILENLKGEAVRVDTTEAKKNPASATINDSTMEVLKAAERKKIIEKYLKKDQS